MLTSSPTSAPVGAIPNLNSDSYTLAYSQDRKVYYVAELGSPFWLSDTMSTEEVPETMATCSQWFKPTKGSMYWRELYSSSKYRISPHRYSPYSVRVGAGDNRVVDFKSVLEKLRR